MKHAHHAFTIDHPGRDSARHRAAGARQVLIASSKRIATIEEIETEPSLAVLLGRLEPADLILIEGWKKSLLPKLELHRHAARETHEAHDTREMPAPFLFPDDAMIFALATDDVGKDARMVSQLKPSGSFAVFALNDCLGIAEALAEAAWPLERALGQLS